jgi:putative SOS response-associated peptidase YedK
MQKVSGRPAETFCILTTRPNECVAAVHDRMPVILTGGTMPRWIGDRPLAAGELQELTRPIPSEWMTVRPVNRFVSNVRNEGPRCLAPPDATEPELDLGI